MPAIAATLAQKSIPHDPSNITQGWELRLTSFGYLSQRFGPFFSLVFFSLFLTNAPILQAGGGPENLMLVVNSNSQASLEIANHYARLYNLPVTNVLHIDYQGDVAEISGTQFRDEILIPILKAIDERGLSAQIDLIAYSCDFPWRIMLKDLFPEEKKFTAQQKPWASLNGATYLWQSVIQPSSAVVSMHSNWYVPSLNSQNITRCKSLEQVSSRGFRGRYYWKPDGSMTTKINQGRRYFLSTVLGVVYGRGNTVDEILESLRRSAYANADAPQGTFYFMRRSEVRSTTRHDCFKSIAKQINAIGGKAVIEDGVFPKTKDPILGLMIGRSDLPLDREQPNIQRGAICEHLTSYGGVMHDRNLQTPISALIRAGASGASGTIYEPYAIQAKFPMPSLHLHYRRGCNLAESFYQSVLSPYQLLIVGDPLCQPWANRPVLEVAGWKPGGELKVMSKPAAKKSDEADAQQDDGTIDSEIEQFLIVQPKAKQLAEAKQAICEFYVDGKLRIRMSNGSKALVKIDTIPDGWHEVRCVLPNNDAIEARASQSGWFLKQTGEDASNITAAVSISVNRSICQLGENFIVKVVANEANEVVLRSYAREIGRLDGASGEIAIDSKLVGKGPIRLQAYVDSTGASSAPAWITVQ